jgi:NitT/TauT family transport system substrate-binding protein
MPSIQSRRRFLTKVALAGTMGLGGAGALIGGTPVRADEGPPETPTVRLLFEEVYPGSVNGVLDPVDCTAPLGLARELLAAEGFADTHYVAAKDDLRVSQAFLRDELDFSFMLAPDIVRYLDAGVPLTVLAGIHPGCFELFAQRNIRTFTDLKGKQVGVNDARGSAVHTFVSIMAAHFGLDPKKDIKWIMREEVAGAIDPIELYVQGKIDAYLAFVPKPQWLRSQEMGRANIDMANDKPWADYFCCMLVGRTEFVRKYPVATKRAVRAILKATDLCSTEPEWAAQRMVERGLSQHYDVARQMLKDLPYASWRELDPADSLRFYAVWLHEFGELKLRSAPNEFIDKGADWHFLEQIKRELKT